jgi:DNA invertase Pin-like site-specific DNA recombinase
MVRGMKAVGYIRLSREGNGHGLEAQRQSIRDHCARHGWELLHIEEDEAASGKSRNGRPGLGRALELVASGGADVLVAARLDRLTRSLLDFAALVEQAQRQGWSLAVVDQSFDLSTPNGRAMAGMLAVFAQWERETISARTKAGLAVARRKGRIGGNPAFKPVPPELAQRIYTMSTQEGLSYARIAEVLNAEGVPTMQGGKSWSKGVIARIVQRTRG